jgi:hypothetical protein
MAQNALTVLNPNPTPPHNLSSVGATPPFDPLQPQADDGYTPGTSYPSGTAFAAKTAAAGSGTSVDAEGKGTEVVFTQTYNPAVATPAGPLQTFSDLGNYTWLSPTSAGVTTSTPNQQHASSLSPATNPALASISPTTAVSGASGTDTITCTGTNFTRQSVVYANGVAQPTTYVSATSITAVVKKKTSAGAWPITVVTGGVVTTAAQTLTYS